MTYIYAFGSIVRGELQLNSDIDLLAITDKYNPEFDRNKFSIYSPDRLKALWEEGNPFAWHLSQESKLIFSSNGIDILDGYGEPSVYKNGFEDCMKFRTLFADCVVSLNSDSRSKVFEFSTVFLCLRNFATCFHLYQYQEGIFSRNSAFMIGKHSIDISESQMNVLRKCRMLSTRGLGDNLLFHELEKAHSSLPTIETWMDELLEVLR